MSTSIVSSVAGVPTQESFISKTVTLTGAAGLGAVGAVPIFTVTGEVFISKIVPICTVDLVSAGGGSLALGVTGSTSLFVGATTATAIDVGEFWLTTTPAAGGSQLHAGTTATVAGGEDFVITDNIIGTVSVADVTAGAIRFDVYYKPLSSDGTIV